MDHVTGEVRALLQEHQDRRKAALDQRRRAVYFEVGDEVLLDTTHTPLPSRDKLSARWMGPFKILAKTAPNTYRLAVPAAWRAFNEFNVERLRRYLRRPLELGGDADEPPPVVAQDGSLEHEVAAILQFRLRAGRPQVLVRWAGQDASGESWEPLENLTNCEAAIAAFERSAASSFPAALPLPRRRWWGVFLPCSPLPATPWTLCLVTWAARWLAGASSTGGARTAGSWSRSRASRRKPPSPTSLLIIGARPRSQALPTRCLTQPLTAPLGSPSPLYPPPAFLAPARGRPPTPPRR